MMQIGMARVALDEKQFSNFATPVAGTGSNLFTFLAARLSASFENLGCGALLNAPNPVKPDPGRERGGHRGQLHPAGHRHPARRSRALGRGVSHPGRPGFGYRHPHSDPRRLARPR